MTDIDSNNTKFLESILKGTIGHCHAVFNIFDEETKETNTDIMSINSLYVNEEYRGQGIGSYLLANMIKKAEKNKIKMIELEDDSDRFKKKNNIYYNFGFHYAYDYDPKMIGYIENLVENERYFIFKNKLKKLKNNIKIHKYTHSNFKEYIITFSLKET